MSDEYVFDQNAYTIPMETRVLVTDGASVWQTEEHGEPFTSSADTTLSESYMTATGDNSTQYFSVLETSTETILNNISQISLDVTKIGNDFTLEDHEISEIQNETPPEADNQEVILFSVDGSDELYGIQVAQDEKGNLQKFQFQVRQNADGQLESIPETIQLLPYEGEETADLNVQDPQIEEQPTEEVFPVPETVCIKEEHANGLNMMTRCEPEVEMHPEEEMQSNDQQFEEENYEELPMDMEDTKSGILAAAFHQNEIYVNSYENQKIEGSQQNEINQEEMLDNQETETQEDAVDLDYDAEYIHNEPQLDNEEQEPFQKQEVIQYEEEPVYQTEESETITANVDLYFQENEEDNYSFESENSDILNDQSINGDAEEYLEELHISGEEELQEYNHIIIDNDRLFKTKIIDEQPCEVLPNTFRASKVIPKRSYKDSCAIFVKNVEKENFAAKTYHTIRKTNPRSILKTSIVAIEPQPQLCDKRFTKGKVATQARQLQHYISQTKILEAPIRQERLPRKQQIKPLNRVGEEIVVQEVVVSSNGFIETREDGVVRERRPLIPTECIQLSDSDDSTNGKKRKRKSRKKKEPIEIVISDSEEETDKIPENTEHKCTKCSKTFPSAGSLRTHLQFHNFSEMPKNNTLKYKCQQCSESFKNNALLTRHMNLHKNGTFKLECNICKKLFSDNNQLLIHKRSHVKSQMFKATSVQQVSPKKNKSSTSKSNDSIKCTECSKVFVNVASLNNHMSIHKKFTCLSCPLSFSSKLLYDNHRMKNCVKSPAHKKLSFVATRKSALPSANSRRLSFKKPSDIKPRRTLGIQAKCDSCTSVFTTHKALLEHKVTEHGLSTPDKSIGRGSIRQSLYKERREHSGVPAAARLKQAFAGLRSKIDN